MTAATATFRAVGAASRELVMTRTLDAAPEAAFRAWTEAAQLARWWGPAGFTNPVCEAEPRLGGRLRIVMRAPDGTEYPMRGTFTELDPPHRLAFAWEAMDASGAVLLSGETRVVLRALGARTQITVATSGRAMADGATRMLDGMEAGWTQSLDRLAAHAAGKPVDAAEPAMTLYYFDAMNPRKACAVSQYLDAPVQLVWLDPRRGEFRAPDFCATVNPNAQLPVLVDGDRVVWESNAIMCHLAMRAGSPLWPTDERQIDVVRWLSWDGAHFSRHTGALYFENFIKARFRIGDPDPAAVAEAIAGFRRYAAVLDAHLAEREYLVGDGLTIADFAVAAALPWAEPARIPIGDFSAVARWHARLDVIPAWRAPFPELAA